MDKHVEEGMRHLDIRQDVEKRIERAEKHIEELRECLPFVEKDNYEYKVTLVSAWSDHGEKNVSMKGKTLAEAEHAARQEFKRVNDRSDVQCSSKYVMIVFPNGYELRPHLFMP